MKEDKYDDSTNYEVMIKNLYKAELKLCEFNNQVIGSGKELELTVNGEQVKRLKGDPLFEVVNVKEVKQSKKKSKNGDDKE